MEMDSSTDVGSHLEDIDHPAKLLKEKLNASSDENTSVCNGNIPVNGDVSQGQNGNHDKEQTMETDNLGNTADDSNQNGGKRGSEDDMVTETSENGASHTKKCEVSQGQSVKDEENMEETYDNSDRDSNYESSKDSTDVKFVESRDDDSGDVNSKSQSLQGSPAVLDDEDSKLDTSRRATPVMEVDSKSQTPQGSPSVGDNDSKPMTPLSGEFSKVESVSSSKAESAIGSNVGSSGTNTPVDNGSAHETYASEPQEDLQRALDLARRDKKLVMIEEAAKDNDDLRPVAKRLYGIGMDLARQQIYKDLYRVQSKKQSQNKLNNRELKQLDKLKTAYDDLISKNDTYQLDLRSCEKCGFKTESKNVIEWHLEFAHGQDEAKYECSFCDFETRLPAPFFFHMEAEHNRKGRVFMKKAFFSCPQCPYENNTKSSVNKHRLKCDRQFNLKRNQEPLPTDCDIPLKKPKTIPPKRIPGKQVPVQIASAPAGQRPASNNALKTFLETRGKPTRPPAIQPRVGPDTFNSGRIQGTVQSLLSAQRQQLMNQQVLVQHRPRILQQAPRAQMASPSMYTLVNTQGQLVLQPTYTGTSMQQPVQQVRPSNQPIQFLNTQQNIQQLAQQVVQQVTAAHAASQKGKPEVTSKPGQASHVKPSGSQGQAGSACPQFEICEICGGFVKDRESLRIHFYWAHKVDIQKDVFSRLTPHLKCEVCPQSFWTYQGLVRHRQMSHAKAKERTYRCYLCGAKNIANIITHLNAAHNVSLNTMYKTGKCLVCGLGFAGEKGLKRHIHTAHLELLKGQSGSPQTKSGAADQDSSPNSKAVNKSPGGVKPVPTGLFENSAKKQKKFEPVCSICNIVFPNVDAFTLHCNRMHVFKCTRCTERWATRELLQKHWHDKHRSDTEPCVLCHESVCIGRPLVRHMKRSHLREVSVVLVRMKKSKVDYYMKRLDELAKQIEKSKPKPEVIVLDDDDTPSVSKVADDNKPKPAEKALDGDGKETTSAQEEILEVDGEQIVVRVSVNEDEEADQSGKKDTTVEKEEKHTVKNDEDGEREETKGDGKEPPTDVSAAETQPTKPVEEQENPLGPENSKVTDEDKETVQDKPDESDS